MILAGPEPKSLVDPVSGAQLRREVFAAMHEWADWAYAPTRAGGMGRWLQPLLVLSYCRMLHTLESGQVASKREAGEWALGALDSEWAGLIEGALDDRPDPWVWVYQPADPQAVGRTRAFVDYVLAESAAWGVKQ